MEKLKVAVVNCSDFFVIRKTEDVNYVAVEGFEYELLKVLSRALRFSYDIVSPEDNEWGSLLENGSWTGMIGLLQKNKADLIVDAFTLTQEASRVVKISFPYSTDRLTFVIKAAKEASKDFVYTYPFDFPLWVSFVLLLIISGILIAFLQRISFKTIKKNGRFLAICISAIEVLIGSQSYNKVVLRKVSTQVLLTFCLLSMRVFTYCYTAVFLSFLMTPVMEPQIRTLSELVKACDNSRVKVTLFSDMKDYFFHSDDVILQSLSKHTRANPNDIISSDDDTIPWIMNGYAVIVIKKLAEAAIYSSGMNMEIFMSPDSLQMTNLGIAFRKEFCCVKKFDQMILRILQAGIYDKIFHDHMFRLRLKAPLQKSHSKIRQIKLSDVRGALWVVCPFYLLSILTFVLEQFVYYNR